MPIPRKPRVNPSRAVPRGRRGTGGTQRRAAPGNGVAGPAHLRCMSTHTTPAGGGKDPQQLAVGGLEPLLSIETLADYVGVPVVTIYRWRTEGKGPCAVRIGRHLKFALSDVQAWLETVRETEPGTEPGRR